MAQRIITNNRYYRDIADDAWRVLLRASNKPVMFLRGLEVVELRRDADGRIAVTMVTRDALRDTLDRVADFVTVRKSKGGKASWSPSSPPPTVVGHMLAHPHPQIPVLKGVAEAPVFSAGGQLLQKPGYHRSAGIFVDLPQGFRMRPVPRNPGPRQVSNALSELLDVFKDFPFITAVDRVNAVGFLLLPFVRDMMDGATPLHLIESPTEGTGKDYLVDVCAAIATGTRSTSLSPPRDESEWRRTLTAMFLSGCHRIHLNNINELASSTLAGAITSQDWSDRLVGSSREVRAPIYCLWVATGNNPRLSREMARRVVPIRLDAGRERPADRRFSVPNLVEVVLSRRWDLVRDVLILVQAWISAGRRYGSVEFGSFTAYARILGGILENAGLQGFLTNRDRTFQAPDPEREELEVFISHWWEKHGEAVVCSRDLYDMVGNEELLPTVIAAAPSPAAGRTRLGKLLAKHRDQVIVGWQVAFVGNDGHTHATKWRLMQTPDAKDAKGAIGGYPTP
ncbi:MAG: hypothetical protein QGI49_03255 [SAR202 cluster bacterium]|nr:hypothetical protein [SAR202 cluster bacterium]